MVVKIFVESPNLFADSPFNIRITGLHPYQEATVRMISRDYYNINTSMALSPDTIWQSQAIFLTNAKGSISLNKTPAISGSYTGVSEMGLFFNLQPTSQEKKKLSKNIKNIPLFPSFHLQIQVIQKEEILEEIQFERYYLDPDTNYHEVQFKQAIGRLFCRKNQQQMPAIIVLSGSDGRIEKAQNIAQLLSNHGFACLALAYFGLDGVHQTLNQIPLEIIKEAIDFLKGKSDIASDRIGIYGRSKGAEFALVAASLFSDIHCLVLNSPSMAVLEGLKGYKNSKASSWTYHNNELPYTAFSIIKLIKQRFFKQLCNFNPQSIIPVEKIQANILLIASPNDEIWPAYQASLNILKKVNQKYVSDLAIYPNSRHMLTVAYQGNHRYHQIPWERLLQDSIDSWRKTVYFFKQNL